MSQIEAKITRDRATDSPDSVSSRGPGPSGSSRRRLRMLPVIITLITTATAAALGWAAWNTYMAAPWTRDGTVRAYVVTMAPEAAGRIVELPVADNQFVRKGDLLMLIDPTNYTTAVKLAEAAVAQAQPDEQNQQAESARRHPLTTLST